MCKYCEDLFGETRKIASRKLEINGLPIGELETYMTHYADDNETTLESSLCVNDNYIDAVTKINFCPFCGCDLRKKFSHN